jgi:hypothetical protein
MQWQPIETEPDDGSLRLYGLHVRHADGHNWFEIHYLSRADDGEMIQPSGDNFVDWTFDDFEVWAEAPTRSEAHSR